MSWQRVMKERKENQRKRMTPSDLLGRELRRTTHIRKWYAFNGFKWTDIDPFYLDWLFADEDREAVLSSPYFINKRFQQYIDYNTAGQQSVKIYIEGWAGVGKTTLAQEVGHLILDKGNGVGKLHHVFGLEPFARIFEEDIIKTGDVALADDIRYLEGEGSVKIVNRIANLANNLRFEEHHMIFVSSQALHAAKINPFCKLMMGGKLHSTQETIALVYLGEKLRGKIKLKIRDPQAFEASVLEAKKESMRVIKLSGGKATVDLEHKIQPMKEKLNFQPQGIREFIVENVKDRKLKVILSLIFKEIKQKDIVDEVGLSQGKISERVTKFGESKLGYIIEEFFRNKFEDKRDFLSRASQGTPDVITKDGEILSIKGHINYKNSQIIYPLMDCRPELDAGDKFRIIYVNPIWHDGYMEYEIDSKKPPNWVSFRKDGRVESG